MSREAVAQVVQRSLSDPAFRRRIATDPTALGGFDLTSDEMTALRSGEAQQLRDRQRMSKLFTLDPGTGTASGRRGRSSVVGATRSHHTRIVRSLAPAAVLAVAVPLVLASSGAPARAAMPDEDPEPMPSLVCVERVPFPAIANVLEAKWSPDSSRLAVSAVARIPSSRTVTGYEEEEHLDVFDLRSGMRTSLGIGDVPRWSATGRYVAYWGPEAEELIIVEGWRIVARLAPTIPDVRWVGDGLLFVERSLIREWRDGAVRTIAQLEEPYVPHYPHDDLYFSADGEHFTLTRYGSDGATTRFMGTTVTGAVAPLDLDDAPYVEWAPAGATLLVRHTDRLALRAEDGATRTIANGPGRAPVHVWSPDGSDLLLGHVSATVPGADAFDRFRSADGALVATLPNLLGERRFSPDGRYFVGTSRTGTHTTRLEVFRCRGAPDRPRDRGDSAARLNAIDLGPGRFVRPVAGEITQFRQGGHTGVDVAAPLGSLITADDDGIVTAVEYVDVGGERVCVQHAGALESCFYHTSLPLVSVGDRVVRGEPVALIGMTGDTTGPHTHWEVKLARRIVDPLTY